MEPFKYEYKYQKRFSPGQLPLPPVGIHPRSAFVMSSTVHILNVEDNEGVRPLNILQDDEECIVMSMTGETSSPVSSDTFRPFSPAARRHIEVTVIEDNEGVRPLHTLPVNDTHLLEAIVPSSETQVCAF